MPDYEAHPLAVRVKESLPQQLRSIFRICAADEVTSTNTILKEHAASAVSAELPIRPTVLIARSQSCGRGRLGRSFHSPEGTGLYMSILLVPSHSMPPAESLYLTTATAAACAEAADTIRCPDDIQQRGTVGIKWVNDLYLSDKKICGILAEAALTPMADALAWAVIGIGINLLPPKDGFPEDLCQTAGALFSSDHTLLTDALIARLCADIVCRLTDYLDPTQKNNVRAIYRQRSVLDGRAVLVRPASSLGGAEIPAAVIGIDDDFGLMVRYEDGHEAVLSSGEVVMRDNGSASAMQSARASVHLL